MIKSKFMPVVVLTIILFFPVWGQADIPLSTEGKVPAGPFQDLQNQIDAIELIPGPQGPQGPQGPAGPPGPRR